MHKLYNNVIGKYSNILVRVCYGEGYVVENEADNGNEDLRPIVENKEKHLEAPFLFFNLDNSIGKRAISGKNTSIDIENVSPDDVSEYGKKIEGRTPPNSYMKELTSSNPEHESTVNTPAYTSDGPKVIISSMPQEKMSESIDNNEPVSTGSTIEKIDASFEVHRNSAKSNVLPKIHIDECALGNEVSTDTIYRKSLNSSSMSKKVRRTSRLHSR